VYVHPPEWYANHQIDLGSGRPSPPSTAAPTRSLPPTRPGCAMTSCSWPPAQPPAGCRCPAPTLLECTPYAPSTTANVYVIEHANGLVLFDTGQDRASVTDDAYFRGRFTGSSTTAWPDSTSAKPTRWPTSSTRSGTPPRCRHRNPVPPAHQDHIGGVRELTDAKLLVSAAEWQDSPGSPRSRAASSAHTS
jgi:hypothetical protein